MPTTVDLAELSRAVYNDEASISVNLTAARQGRSGRSETWNRTDHASSGNGFFGALYENGGGESVVAFRGTEFVDGFGTDVIGDDLQIFLGRMPPQALTAIAFAEKHKNKNPILTGHSLGGALAVITAARLGMPALTFNAPGMEDSCQLTARHLLSEGTQLPTGLIQISQMVARCQSNPRVQNIRIGGDPVSNYYLTGAQPGETTTLRESQCTRSFIDGFSAAGVLGGLALQALCRHSMDTVVSTIRSRPESYHPIHL